MALTPEKAVATGVARLNRRCRGWTKKVDLEKFSMSSHKYHLLAQLYGTIEIGITKLAATPATHGFKEPWWIDGGEEARREWRRQLEEEWRKVIQEKQK
jgi:hypothetical protein